MGSRACWTVDPSIKVIAEIAHRHLKLSVEDIAQTKITFQFQGAFNKLYAVECPKGSFFMRVSLPVDPHFKTESEVATVRHLQSRTSVPVPNIIASQSSSDNELRFEWILMERVHGLPLADVWVSLPWDAKVSCVKDVAMIMAQLFEVRYDAIGNLLNAKNLSIESERPPHNDAAESNAVVVGRIVSMIFFWNKHLTMNVPRGPFASSKEWLEARFQLMEEDCRSVLESQDADEDDIEDMELAQELLKRLLAQLPSLFPSNTTEREKFALHHDDISRHNLIIDSKETLQALLDWECVSVMPLWMGCQIPSFIETAERTERPDPERYTISSQDSSNSLYQEHLDEYECTRLRECFLEEMARLAPGWITEYQTSRSKADFDKALANCDGGFGAKMVKRWLDHLEAGGEYRSLHDF